jgi:alpha-ketoglutarate-dependent taurine dioxygenase
MCVCVCVCVLYLQFYKRLLNSKTTPLQLSVGTMVLVHNARILHGREAFAGARNLLGAYMDQDELDSKARVLGLFPPQEA